MRAQVHRDATAELEAAAEWYESEEEGLGEELLEEVARALAVIAESPMIWPSVRRKGTLRRFVLSRFPFAIIYAVVADRVRVFAIAHQKRRPGYWRHRRFQ